MCDNTERVTIIEDNDLLNTDVSELVKGDYYLFHLTNDEMYIYKDGVVCINNIYLQKEGYHYRVPYTNGTLREFILAWEVDNGFKYLFLRQKC